MPETQCDVLLVNPERVELVEAALHRFKTGIFPSEQASLPPESADRNDGSDDGFWDDPELAWARPYTVRSGSLVIPVSGVLLKDFPYTLKGIVTGYEYIGAALSRGLADPEVGRIVLDIDSPGGLVGGLFDLADRVYYARSEKPIVAVANEHAYSAAYAIASAASEITVARTGGVGSVGVVVTHVDVSKALENEGVRVTFVHAGKRKVDGNPYQALSERARNSIQSRVNAIYDIFVATVARNRGIGEEAVRQTEAAIFLPREAIEVGFADRIGSLDETLSAFAEPVTRKGDDTMSKDNSAVEETAHEEALAAARAEGVEAGKTAGAEAERARIGAILDSDEAKLRPAAARQVALKTGLSVEDARAFLTGLPEEKGEENPGSMFVASMNGDEHPNLGAGADTPGTDAEDRVARAFAAAGVRYEQ